jgi:hypothetical protein
MIETDCGGPVYPEVITSLDFGTITYKCGDVIKSQIFFSMVYYFSR